MPLGGGKLARVQSPLSQRVYSVSIEQPTPPGPDQFRRIRGDEPAKGLALHAIVKNGPDLTSPVRRMRDHGAAGIPSNRM